jgi:hypothetical protein
MSEDPEPQEQVEEQELAPYRIEAARSSRSRCRTCRRKIDKGALRLGVLLEGPYGTGYLWHHLACAARKRFEDVEGAYGEEAWEAGLQVPALDELRKLKQESEEKQAQRRELPYLERAPSGRSKCKHCAETIAEGAWRAALAREVRFGNQVRSTPINVHAACVAAEIRADDCLTEIDGFADAVRANSRDVAPEEIEAALAEVGELG